MAGGNGPCFTARIRAANSRLRLYTGLINGECELSRVQTFAFAAKKGEMQSADKTTIKSLKYFVCVLFCRVTTAVNCLGGSVG